MITTSPPRTRPSTKPAVIVALLGGLAFFILFVGPSAYRAFHRARELHEARLRIDANLDALGRANVSLRQARESTATTRSSGARTIPQFLTNYRAMRPAVAQWRQSLDEMQRILGALDRDAKGPPDPAWDAFASVLHGAVALDAEQLRLVEEQIARAESMEGMPPSARPAYFEETIRPLLHAEIEIGKKRDALQDEMEAAAAELSGQ